MLTPVVCFDCGLPVGDEEDLFREMRAELVERVLRERGTDPASAPADAGLQIDCGEILDELNVHMGCCRTRLISALIFTDLHG